MMRAFLPAATLIAVVVSAQPRAQQAGRIAGLVTTPDAGLVADATVTLTGRSASGRSATTRSGRGGEFSFENLPGGEYTVSASKPGYTDREVLQSRGLRSGLELSLGDGEQSPNIEIAVRRSASIAGRIVQPDGTPAPNAEVMIAVRDGSRLHVLVETRTTSAWDGRYELTDLPPGEFLVVVTPPPLVAPLPGEPAAPARLEPTLYPGVPPSEPGQTVRVYEGTATEGIDVWLTPAPQRFAVSGRVFWPDGIELNNLVIEYGGSPEVRSGVWYVNDPGGLFTIEGASQGTLVMLARADSNRGPLIGLATTEVTVASVEEVRLVLAAPGRVEGRLVVERPLPMASVPRVSLVHALLKVSPLYPQEDAAVGADGRFEVLHARGEYTFEVRGLPAGWKVKRVLRGGRALAGNRLLVEAGGRITAIEVVVGPDSI